jgi:hypothetical protein
MVYLTYNLSEKRQHKHEEATESKGPDMAAILPAGLASTFSGGGNFEKAMKIEQLKPVLRSNARKTRFIYGPYKIAATNACIIL